MIFVLLNLRRFEEMQNTHPPLSYDQRLAITAREGHAGARRAALTLFERRAPKSLSEAVDLVLPYGAMEPELFDVIRCAYDMYRHSCDQPSD
jgi:hypothetical protein